MGIIIGYFMVAVCVACGLLIPSHWNFASLGVLMQPSEFIVIGGSGLMTVVIANPGNLVKTLVTKKIPGVIKGSGITKQTYLDLLGLMANFFDTMRRDGVLGIENDLANPAESPRFQKYPAASSNHHAMETFIGALRLFVDGVVNAFELERMLDTEIETHHEEESAYPAMVAKLADSFPGLGIVAAVLGITITMGALSEGPESIGHHVAAALVGTLLGILLSYGFVGPVGTKMEYVVKDNTTILKTIQIGLVAFAGGSPPQVALEFSRKTIPSDFRPTAEELEQIIKDAKSTGGAKEG